MTEERVNIQLIDDNPFQDRGVYEGIDDLGRTIANNGLQQIPKARKIGARFQLEFGHRRKRAFLWLHDNWQAEGLPDRYDGYSVMPLQVEVITDDQMFDGVVIENVHRDDLRVTEKARLLRRYKEVHPTATSKQIGLVFNMNDATVRGMDIFLDLPDAVQRKLDDGTITMGTARLFHSMQRIATEESILATLKQVEKESGNSLPEEVIERALDRMNNVVEMWNDNQRDGKPKSGYHGWPLDMKNLPSRLLPRMDEQTAGIYEAKIEHLVNPPACTACPFYAKVRGSHYCGLKICHQRKGMAWEDYSVELANKHTKIAIYTETDGAYRALGYNDNKLFEKRHKDLRLMPARRLMHTYQNIKGLDDDLVVVVATGAALEKIASTSHSVGRGKKTEKEKSEMRALKIYRVKRKELLWEFTACAKTIFEKLPPPVLEWVISRKYLGVDQQPPVEKPKRTEAQVFDDYQRRLLVWLMIEDCSSSYRREPLVDVLSGLVEFVGEWKIKIPASLSKMAEEMDAEIDSVSAETKAGKK